MDRKQFEAKIIAKAWKDASFREALKRDPKGTLATELESLHSGAKLPANLQVTVVEESADHIYLVIPNSPTAVSGALDDASLEAVAGGAGGVATVATQVSGLDTVAQVQAVSAVVTTVSGTNVSGLDVVSVAVAQVVATVSGS